MALERISDTYWMDLRWGGWVDLRAPDAPRGITLPRGPTIYAIANAQTWAEQLFNGFKWDMNAAYASFARRAGDCCLRTIITAAELTHRKSVHHRFW